ncbi:Rv0518 family GDSL lipase [Mycobacterium deserti]|uniref:SGNH/GDSL hydrolase family protein n=1 Tax=Mycobacterium deserti TaxID=2978347 RepID=A0ABT2MIK2_9MYCO|nr:GDSL lipase [Mycobacterium deserti]MCT7661811.1 SGNH/GDSL hydrolase family protein [Mycobacterium deserti]
MRRLTTVAVSLALLFTLGCERPIAVSHKEIVALDFSVRVAVVGDSYTTGGHEGGMGPKGWTTKAWQMLAQQRTPISADVGAEGGAGYGTRGNRGSIFEDLTARTVERDDALVVFFGSRNDQKVEPTQLSILTYGTFQLARRLAPSAKFLVIGPPWPTADPPLEVLRIRDILRYQAGTAGATFVDPIAEGWFVGQPGLIGADGVHPTDAGHAYMADKIAPLIGAAIPARY